MFWTLQRLYNSGQLDKPGLQRAVDDKGWITPDQYQEIAGEPIPQQ